MGRCYSVPPAQTGAVPLISVVGNVEQHGEVMTGASAQYKHMPESMEVREAVKSIEDDATV